MMPHQHTSGKRFPRGLTGSALARQRGAEPVRLACVAQTPLVGRTEALGDLQQAWSRAQQGAAQVRVVHGRAGSGKSTLLRAFVEQEAARAGGEQAGARYLQASGHVAETAIPFAGLHQLLGPVGHAVDELPDPARAQLRRALALETGPAPDLLAVAGALLILIAGLSRGRPLLIAVDDVHWLDASSRQVLVFLARRLEVDAVCLLLGVRTEHTALLRGVGQSVELAPLAAHEVQELLRLHHPDLASMPAARIAAAAGGLPLALVEIPSELTPEQRAGTEPLPDRLPIGDRLGLFYERRIAALDDQELFALLLASFEPLDESRLESALTTAGLGLRHFARAERSALVRIVDGRCQFQHPTARAAIQHSAPIAQTRSAHRILAELWQGQPERATAHLVHVPDADPALVAAGARTCAQRAADTNAHAEAAGWWEVVAEHAPHQAAQARSHACRQYALAGAAPQAARLLEELLSTAQNPRERADLSRQVTVVSVWWQAQAPENHPELAALGSELTSSREAADRAAGIALLSALAMADLAAGEYRRAWSVCRQLLTGRPGPELPPSSLLLCDAVACMIGAQGAGRHLRGDWVGQGGWDEVDDPESPTGFVVVVLGWLEELDTLRLLRDRAEAMAEVRGPTVAAAHIRGWMGALLAQAEGDWDRADLAYAAVERLLLDSDYAGPFPFLTLRHAELHAGRGDADKCQALRRQARDGARAWPSTLDHLDAHVRGLLALSLRDFTTAARALAEAAAVERRSGAVLSGYTTRFPNEFEAHWHLGTAEGLRGDLDRFEEQMAAVGHRTMLGLAARCRAMVCPPAEVDTSFAAAVELLDGGPHYELARTQLLWGQRLRRQRRKADARSRLRAAEEIFTRLGASAWMATCRSELAACGERRAAPAGDHVHGSVARLTPREYEVAREVAAGASNAQAARRLFISERTVEFHLSRIYRKLDVPGREQLQQHIG